MSETPERTQCEVDMLIVLGTSLIAAQGYTASEVEETYTRARQLCAPLDDPHQLFPVLWGVWVFYTTCAAHRTAHALGAQLLTLAQQAQDTAMLPAAHRAVGSTLFHLGAPTSAHTHLAQAIALYDAKHHRASVFLYGEVTGMVCRSHDAMTLWWLGYPDQGLARNAEAVMLAQQMAHPYSLVYAVGMAAIFHQFHREWQTVQEHTEAAIRLIQEQGFPYWRAFGAILGGWALAQQGQAQEGIAQITQGLTAYRATGAEVSRPYLLALLAEAHGIMGQPEAGLAVLTEALTLADATGERWYEAELYRLQGELLLQQSLDHQAEAESCFHHALVVAHNQQTKSWELRAATSLARLWQKQGKPDEARQVLVDVYGWFTEGFDTADLKDAKALLEMLGEEQHDV